MVRQLHLLALNPSALEFGIHVSTHRITQRLPELPLYHRYNPAWLLGSSAVVGTAEMASVAILGVLIWLD